VRRPIAFSVPWGVDTSSSNFESLVISAFYVVMNVLYEYTSVVWDVAPCGFIIYCNKSIRHQFPEDGFAHSQCRESFSSFHDTGRWAKSRNPSIPSVTRPLGSTSFTLCSSASMCSVNDVLCETNVRAPNSLPHRNLHAALSS
jgi:hypothetical protein